MKNKKLLLSIMLLLFLQSCKKQMEVESRTISLNEFDTLTLNSVFEVELTQGDENTLIMEGAKKILDKVTIEQSNNSVTLKNNFKGNWMYPSKNKVKLRITCNGLNKINANETCNITSMNTLQGVEIGLVMTSKLNEANLQLNCSTFYYWNNFPCGGKLTLSGNVQSLKLWNVALMAVDASSLNTFDALVENSSKGDCRIRCTNELTYGIQGEGNIYVSGNPTSIVSLGIGSSGQLILE